MTAPDWLHGVCPVLEVPFHTDEAVDYDGFDRVVDHVLGAGVPSVMFPGYASEFHKLEESERGELVNRLLQAAGARHVSTVIAVQDHATHLAVRRSVRAAEAGAGAINVLPPYLLGPSPAAVRAHLRAVLAAVAPLPVIVQYAPAQTGTSLDAAAIAALADQHSNLAAVKVESAPPGRLIEALAAAGIHALVGYAGLQLPDALRRGAIGVQPGCSFTELYVQVWSMWHEGRQAEAEALHRRMVPYLAYWMQSVELIVAAEKLISQRRGIIASATCRAPAYELDAAEVTMVDAFLSEFAGELDAAG